MFLGYKVPGVLHSEPDTSCWAHDAIFCKPFGGHLHHKACHSRREASAIADRPHLCLRTDCPHFLKEEQERPTT